MPAKWSLPSKISVAGLCCSSKVIFLNIKNNASFQVKHCLLFVSSVFLEKPVRVFRDMLNVKATPGEDPELSCEITKPDATVKWLKNGRLIRVSSKYEIIQKDYLVKLIIHNAAIMDSGEYCCEADGIATRARLDVRGKYFLIPYYKVMLAHFIHFFNKCHCSCKFSSFC